MTTPEGDFHSWVVVAASSLIFVLNGCIFNTQGILFREFLRDFGAGEVATSWLIGVLIGMIQLSGMIASWLSNILEYRAMTIIGSFVVSLGLIGSSFVHDLRVFYVTYSITIGLGMGFQYVPALLAPQVCFHKKRALAIAIAVSGCPIGSLVFCPVFQFLINVYEWRGAMFITGAIIFNGCAFGLLLTHQKLERSQRNVGSADVKHKNSIKLEELTKSDLKADMDRENNIAPKNCCMKFLAKAKSAFDMGTMNPVQLLTVFVMWMCFTLGLPILSNFLPLVALSYGISETTASLMLSLFGCFDFLGRLLFGVIGSCQRMNAVYLWCYVSIAAGLGYICLTWAKTMPAMLFFVVVYGLHQGGWLVCSSVALVYLFGIDQVAKSYGIMQIAHTTSFFATSALHATFAEVTGKPQMAFFLAGLLQSSGCVMLLVHYTMWRKTKRSGIKEAEVT